MAKKEENELPQHIDKSHNIARFYDDSFTISLFYFYVYFIRISFNLIIFNYVLSLLLFSFIYIIYFILWINFYIINF